MVSKIQALEMMKRISHHVTDECILERIVPFLVSVIFSQLQLYVISYEYLNIVEMIIYMYIAMVINTSWMFHPMGLRQQ